MFVLYTNPIFQSTSKDRKERKTRFFFGSTFCICKVGTTACWKVIATQSNTYRMFRSRSRTVQLEDCFSAPYYRGGSVSNFAGQFIEVVAVIFKVEKIQRLVRFSSPYRGVQWMNTLADNLFQLSGSREPEHWCYGSVIDICVVETISSKPVARQSLSTMQMSLKSLRHLHWQSSLGCRRVDLHPPCILGYSMFSRVYKGANSPPSCFDFSVHGDPWRRAISKTGSSSAFYTVLLLEQRRTATIRQGFLHEQCCSSCQLPFLPWTPLQKYTHQYTIFLGFFIVPLRMKPSQNVHGARGTTNATIHRI